jgi:1-phosphofructokinase family hexose kinase
VILCVGPAPAVDVTYVLEQLSPGRVHRPLEVRRQAGGKAFNVARVLAALGREVAVVSPVGGAAGRWLIEAAALEGIDFDSVVVTGHETRTCVSVCTENGSAPTDFYEPPDPVGSRDWSRFLRRVADRQATTAVLSGALPEGCDIDSLDALARAARGDVLAVDLSGPVVAGWLASGPAVDLVKVNASEAAELLGLPLASEGDLAVALSRARALAERTGASLTIVTLGSSGAIAVDSSRTAVQVPAAGRGRYPVGSGDAFLGALLASSPGQSAWSLRDPAVLEALRAAAAAATVNAQRLGAGQVDEGSVTELRRTVKITPMC